MAHFLDHRTVAVTGGLGFIGSALVRRLLAHTQASVLVIDKLGMGSNQKSLPDRFKDFRYFVRRIDLCDEKATKDIVEFFKPTVIYHLAAETHVDRSITDPKSFVDSNVLGTYSILSAARGLYEDLPEKTRETFRFHHVSTDEVFGTLETKNGFFTEKSLYKPNSPYSASKAASDHLVRAWHKTYGLPVTISNCSNNYGPWQNPEKFIPKIISCALNGETIPLYGTGDNIRDWMHVEDHVDALLACVDKGTVGETYCLGARTELTNIQILYTVLRIIQDHRPELGDLSRLVKYVDDRAGHDYRYAIDPTKAETELGWAPRFTFEQGLTQTVLWYLERSF